MGKLIGTLKSYFDGKEIEHIINELYLIGYLETILKTAIIAKFTSYSLDASAKYETISPFESIVYLHSFRLSLSSIKPTRAIFQCGKIIFLWLKNNKMTL